MINGVVLDVAFSVSVSVCVCVCVCVYVLTPPSRCYCRIPVTVIKPTAIGQGIAEPARPVQAAAPAAPLSVIKAPGLDEMQPSIYDTAPPADIVDTKGKLTHQCLELQQRQDWCMDMPEDQNQI